MKGKAKAKDTKKKLGAEKLEKRKAPFMPITYQDDTEGGGGTTQERNTVSRRSADVEVDRTGSMDRPRYDRER